MAHEIDMTTGRPAIAYVGETPWHNLGSKLTPKAPISVWLKESGMDFKVESSPVRFTDHVAAEHQFAGRNVLYRNDTMAPLSVVSARYNIVQPAEILEFFRKMVDTAGFDLECAGVLDSGRKVWGLAKVNDGAPIIGHDVVRPYVLLATSFDGSLATTAKFTSIRVVCNNTLTMSAGGNNEYGSGQTEKDKTKGAVVQSVRITHSERFDAESVRQQLGIVLTAWDKFRVQARLLAETEMDDITSDKLTYELIEGVTNQRKDVPLTDIRKSRNYRRIMELFSGASIGYDLAGGNTAWGWLNAVTQLVDHERGKSDSTRMDSAWFGTGDGMKNRALQLALSVA
jgi:phage/plasmid-like protein (TIGR03299 family)